MAEAVGFEPTCPCGQLHFECSSLQPLRYASMYKYSLLGTNHMISSRSRYDHFDTPPYSVFDVLSEKGENYTRELVIFRKRALRFLPVTMGIFSGQPSSKAMAFRVSPVMTTSIPLRVCQTRSEHLEPQKRGKTKMLERRVRTAKYLVFRTRENP